ncbi:MAG: AhpC/TSA family protein [Bacteroidetes bacterium]|nr:AhpC/TSA family protein [Bacteroidota bacterium]MBL7102934.1 AhpC/TSA family protein [Bacteroidales bacterium]
MFKRYFFFILIIIAIVSCYREKETGLISITGSFPKYTGEWLYLEELEVRNAVILDSVKINKEGKFVFNLEIEDAGFYILRINKENYLVLQLEKNETVKVNSNNNYFSTGYQVKGSPGSQLLMTFECFMTKQKQRVDSLAYVFKTSQGEPDFYDTKLKLDSIYMIVYNDQRKYVKEFIGKNSGSLASLIIINSKLGNNKVMDEEEDFIYFHRIDSALTINYPENKHTINHHNRVKEIRQKKLDSFIADEKLKPGKNAPDIVIRDINDQIVSLQDMGGQNILVYFWAGWNAKSRQDNKKLVAIYDELKEHNIEIFGVSLDENEKVWKGAIKLDKLPWIQGSDLKGLKSPVNKAYNLNDELPFYYLIDEEGRIILKDNDVDKIIEKLEDFWR